VKKRLLITLALVFGMSAVYGCNAGNKDDKGGSDADKAATATASAANQSTEVVFDPRNPPAGYTKCHRNHCHREDGGVAPADVAAPPADAIKTASGLVSKVIKPGNGKEKPTAESVVSVHYTGWQTNGKAFDSSISRGQPAKFPLNRVIPGWTEGVQLMSVGEERRFWIPEELAYKGRPGAPQGMLVFDVELLSIEN
jgi:FKBP-type peptidyl-prolyl cis-trans isomerase